MDKTNVMRLLDQKKVPYIPHTYPSDAQAMSGAQVAAYLGQDPQRVFKTLVTAGASRRNYVFMIPAEAELDLKKAAKAVGEKSIAMIKSKELLSLTGYIHGGCSPVGMKKLFVTTAHITAADFPTILFSAGKIGHQVETGLDELRKVIPVALADITVQEQT